MIFIHSISRSFQKENVPSKAALELLKKVYGLLQQIGDRHNFKYPNLYLSVDSGFTCLKLIAYCQKNNIGFIGGTKKDQ